MNHPNKTQLTLLSLTQLFRGKPQSKNLTSKESPKTVSVSQEREIDEDEAVGFGPLWSEYDMWI